MRSLLFLVVAVGSVASRSILYSCTISDPRAPLDEVKYAEREKLFWSKHKNISFSEMFLMMSPEEGLRFMKSDLAPLGLGADDLRKRAGLIAPIGRMDDLEAQFREWYIRGIDEQQSGPVPIVRLVVGGVAHLEMQMDYEEEVRGGQSAYNLRCRDPEMSAEVQYDKTYGSRQAKNPAAIRARRDLPPRIVGSFALTGGCGNSLPDCDNACQVARIRGDLEMSFTIKNVKSAGVLFVDKPLLYIVGVRMITEKNDVVDELAKSSDIKFASKNVELLKDGDLYDHGIYVQVKDRKQTSGQYSILWKKSSNWKIAVILFAPEKTMNDGCSRPNQ